MSTSSLFNIYFPGSKFSKNSRSFSPAAVPNPAHNNVLKPHQGDDWSAPTGTDIPVAADGVVIFKGNNSNGYGNYVVVEHCRSDDTQFRTLYAHLKNASSLAVGSWVDAGQTIGYVGQTGGATGPHLHFEIIEGDGFALPSGMTGRQNPSTFTSWDDVPHMIGTDDAGNAIVATTSNGVISCKAVDAAGAMIAGTASSNSDLPGISTAYSSANPGTQYWAVTIDSQAARLYDNGVVYSKDYPTGQEYWEVPTSTGGYTEVTKFGNGVIVTKTYVDDGSIDTTVPGTITLDASASADLKAAFAAWKALGNDPTNIPGANIFLDQTIGGPSSLSLLDARRYSMGSETDSNDVLVGEGTFNGKGGNMLVGGMGDDFLIGGSGDDVLYGGPGNDVLAGGDGNDTYILDGSGKVTIEDKIGTNRVLLNGRQLGELIRQQDGTFMTVDGKISGTLDGGDIVLEDDKGAQITLNANFTEGDFGIHFKDKPQDPVPVNTITGDIVPTDLDPYTSGIQCAVDANGNPLGTAGPYADLLLGTDGNDHTTGGELSDAIGGWAGDDWLEGNAGSDEINAGAGNDLIEGGTESDVLLGNEGDEGDDRIYADVKIETADAIDQGNTGNGSGEKGDWLAGNTGDDTLVGSTGNDVLSGGGGDDLLIAGAGDDIILGDTDCEPHHDWTAPVFNNYVRYTQEYFDWTVTEQGAIHFIAGESLIIDPSDSGNDVIYAGAGNDRAWAGAGDDIVYGEVGNDELTGNSGNDVLFGGAGDDKLYGEEGTNYLDGGDGNDTLDGGEGNDVLIVDVGNNNLYGGAGDDTLVAGSGSDILYGGAGAGVMEVLFGRSKCDAANDTEERMAA